MIINSFSSNFIVPTEIVQMNLTMETILLILGFVIVALIITTIIIMSKEGYLGKNKPKISSSLWKQRNMKTQQEIKQTEEQLKVIAAQLKEKVAQRARKEKKYISLNNQLKELSVRLKQMQQEDKTQIFREINEQIDQKLSALKEDLSYNTKKHSKDYAELINKMETLIKMFGQKT